MRKNHFVLVELKNHDNYPVLLPIKDYFGIQGSNPPTDSLAKRLENQQYKKIKSNDNIIYIPPNFK